MKLFAALALAAAIPALAHAAAAPAPAGPPPTPKAAAPIDITGNWVAIVNEDWRWRMVTPPKGDFPGIPLTPAGRDAANAWDPATDGSCKAYGVGGLMRMPTRLRIAWDGDDALKIETDAGVQTRRLVFNSRGPATGPRTLQGFSAAQWQRPNLVPAPTASRPGCRSSTTCWARSRAWPISRSRSTCRSSRPRTSSSEAHWTAPSRTPSPEPTDPGLSVDGSTKAAARRRARTPQPRALP